MRQHQYRQNKNGSVPFLLANDPVQQRIENRQQNAGKKSRSKAIQIAAWRYTEGNDQDQGIDEQ